MPRLVLVPCAARPATNELMFLKLLTSLRENACNLREIPLARRPSGNRNSQEKKIPSVVQKITPS